MSAAVCGTKRSFYEDLTSPPVTKRIRSSPSATSPLRFAPPESPLDQIRSMFPHVEIQFLERTLRECGGDIDVAIGSLHEVCVASAYEKSESAGKLSTEKEQGLNNDEDIIAAGENTPAPDNILSNGTEWVELLVREVMNSAGTKDAKARLSRVLEILEKSTDARAGEEAAQICREENMRMKQQIEALMKENSILKRGVAIQHERQKDYDAMNQELQHLRQLVFQYQDQLRTLEVNNYALRIHLRHAQQSNCFLGPFNPDVF